MAECVRYIIGSSLSPVTIFFDFPASEVDTHHMDLVLYQESCCWIACCLEGPGCVFVTGPQVPLDPSSSVQCWVPSLSLKKQCQCELSLFCTLGSHLIICLWYERKTSFYHLLLQCKMKTFMHKLQIQKVNPNNDIILSHRIWNFPNLTIFMLSHNIWHFSHLKFSIVLNSVLPKMQGLNLFSSLLM